MKKTLIAFCGAALCLASFADETVCDGAAEQPACVEGAASKAAPARQCPRRPEFAGRMNRPKPVALVINEKTTADQIEAYKKEVAEKIDAAFTGYATKEAGENGVKAPTRIMLMVNDRPMGRPGMGPGMGRGPKGPGMGRGGRRGPKGERPEGAPAPEAAPETAAEAQ